MRTNSVVIYDAAGDSTPTVLPFMLGASLAQGRQHVNIIVSGLSDEEQGRVIEALHIEPVEPAQPRSAFRGAFSNRVRVYFVPLMGESNEFGTTVKRARESRTRAAKDSHPPAGLVESSLTKRTSVDPRSGWARKPTPPCWCRASARQSGVRLRDLLEMAKRNDLSRHWVGDRSPGQKTGWPQQGHRTDKHLGADGNDAPAWERPSVQEKGTPTALGSR